MIRIKRNYDQPSSADGRRILVDRLWPRGMTKEALAMVAWLKDVTPSTELRRWFGHRTERWDEFRRRYKRELDNNIDAWAPIVEASTKGVVTLLYSAHDLAHNHAIVLRDYLARITLSRSIPSDSTSRKSICSRHLVPGMEAHTNDVEQLSPRWRYGVAASFVFGFAFLILLTFTAYRNAPHATTCGRSSPQKVNPALSRHDERAP